MLPCDQDEKGPKIQSLREKIAEVETRERELYEEARYVQSMNFNSLKPLYVASPKVDLDGFGGFESLRNHQIPENSSHIFVDEHHPSLLICPSSFSNFSKVPTKKQCNISRFHIALFERHVFISYS